MRIWLKASITLGVGVGLIVALAGAIASGEEIAGWGEIINPDGDCSIEELDGSVTIQVPGTVHDLWFERKDPALRFNAPRVLRLVEGDFVAHVKMTSDWKLGESVPGGGFVGAGLVIWESEDHYLRLERNAYRARPQDKTALSWTVPIYDRNGKRITAWKTAAPTFFKGRTTWLRMERTHQTVVTSISHDGKTWSETGTVTTQFPASVQVGIEAISGNANGLVVEFEDFAVTPK